MRSRKLKVIEQLMMLCVRCVVGSLEERVIRKDTSVLDERQKPVNEQRGAVQCHVCLKWFKSKGGLAVHRCNLPCET